MLVRERMIHSVVTVGSKTSIHDALTLMKEKRIRRLPVVRGQTLVGIVTWTDLMRASPSPATSLSVWEISYLLMKAPVAEVMTKKVITTSPGATIEEVAVQMRQHKIGGLPVVDDGRVVGIITESDIFDAFIALMGLSRGGTRLTVQIEDRVGALEEVVRTIAQSEVNISSLAMYTKDGLGQAVIRLDTLYPLHLVQLLADQGIKVVHIAPLPDVKEPERKLAAG